MRLTFFILLGIFSLLSAAELLVQVSLADLEKIRESPIIPVAFWDNTIIGRIEEENLPGLGFNYKVIQSLPVEKDQLFFITYPSPYLEKNDAEAILKRYGTILTKDGEAFFIKIRNGKEVNLPPLGFELAHISLKPIVLPPISEAELTQKPRLEKRQENATIRSIIDQITPTELAQLIRELSGEVPVTVRGRLDTIRTRYATAAKNSIALWYLYEKFQTFSLDSVNFHSFSWSQGTDSNIIATKNGRRYPRQYWIIGGHLDCTSESPSTYAPGADDNASGTVAAIIAAKYMSPYPWKYTIKFIGWNTEEFGLYGSDAHAALVLSRGDSLLGVINGDMIATEMTNNDSIRIYTGTRTGSRAIGDTFFNTNQVYGIGLRVRRSTSVPANSDHYSYYSRGFNAVHVFEDDFSPVYHTTGDRITAASFDTIYYTKVVKAMVATLATLAQPDTDITYLSEELPVSNSELQITSIPNPFRTNAIIRIPHSAIRNPHSVIRIYDVMGRLVKSFKISAPSGQRQAVNEFIWDGRDREGKKNSGIYFLILETKDRTICSKLTITE